MKRRQQPSAIAGRFIAALILAACPSGWSRAAEPVRDKTLVAWVQVAEPDRRGGGVLTLQTPGEEFDGIVFGEVAPRRWMAGSDMFHRTQHDQAASAEEHAGPAALVQLAVAYRGREVAIYRDGAPYARYEVEMPASFDDSSFVVMGLRHLAASEPNAFVGAVEEARIYDVALDGPTIASLKPDEVGSPAPIAHWTFEDGRADDRLGRFRFVELRGGARVADGKLMLEKPGASLVALWEKPYREAARSFLRYRPEVGRVGDVIPFHWKGEDHAFFLNDGRWDHIVSTDLVTWKDLPPALVKGDDPLGPDGEACWTGSLVERDGVFHLFYTGKNMRDPAGDQKVMAATSRDLIRWEKDPARTFYADGEQYWGRPVNGPADKVMYHHQSFRDPDVFFHEGEGRWWMLLHALTAKDQKPCIGLYTSPDLRTWTPRPPVASYDVGVSLDCPHAAPTGGKWFIIAADASYTTAPTPGGPYPAGMTPYDVGDLFVPKSLSDGRRRIIWGWVRDLEGGKDRGKPLWGGTMSLPREIFADDQGGLSSRPPAEAVAAFRETALDLASRPKPRGNWRYEGESLVADADGACRFDVPADYLMECTVQVDRGAEFAAIFRQPGEGPGGYPLTLSPAQRKADLRRGDSRFERDIAFDGDRPVAVQAFVVDSIIECFVDGRHAFTGRAYDHAEGSLGLRVTGGGARITGLKVKTLPRADR